MYNGRAKDSRVLHRTQEADVLCYEQVSGCESGETEIPRPRHVYDAGGGTHTRAFYSVETEGSTCCPSGTTLTKFAFGLTAMPRTFIASSNCPLVSSRSA